VLTNKRLLEGEVARKNVLSNVSHDLRTPITAIRGYAELMISAQDNLTLEQRNSYLSNIVRRSEQMERIVADIMELTRMESSDSDFHFTSVSIAEMLDELVVMYSMDLEDSEKHLSLDLPPRDSLIVKADPAKLSRVFENLISNAINYTGAQANIVVKAWRTGDVSHIASQKIHVTVEDNGIGIPEQDIPRIFDRFYRAHNSGVNIKGTGLGLAIVKLICDKHDAEINVTSKLGEGTTFEIILSATY
jgi:signal transduction histidine kinase